MNLTAESIVTAINQLPNNQTFSYINPKNKGLIFIDHIEGHEGPIYIRRFNPSKGESIQNAELVSISRHMIWRIANALREGEPINFDRVLGASYNTRSVLESLLAHTPQFYWCTPGRIEIVNSSSEIQRGHKHLIWLPSEPHEPAMLVEYKTNKVVSEMPAQQAVYDNLSIPNVPLEGIDIDMQRRHAQIQVALIMIGAHLNYKVWVAQNDRGIQYQQKTLGEMDGVIPRLSEGTVIEHWGDAVEAAKLIDCIWFQNGKLMPAVIEVEHTTGVTSGLSRMLNFKNNMPPFPTRYVIAAPDEDRDRVIREINKEQFNSLDARYFPYSAVEELWILCMRRSIRGVTEEFIDSYMEKVTV